MPRKKYDKPNKTIQCIRLLKILKSKKYVKKAEIAYLLGEETTRNINNYKNTLYGAGYPIGYKSGKYGGYYLEFDAMLPSMKMNDIQLKLLGTAYEYLLKESNVPNKKTLLDYLGNAFLENEQTKHNEALALYGHFPLSMPSEEIERRYYIIQTAIDSKRKVKILYKGYNKDSYHIIHPYKLFKYTNWIVFAYDESIKHMLSSFNKFKLHRMIDIELLKDGYTIDSHYKEEAFFDKEGAKEHVTHVKLKVYGRMGRMLEEKVYGQNQVVRCLDSNMHIYLFEADMRNTLVIKKFILSFGSRCEVIEPKELREEIIADAKKTLHYYEKYEKKLKVYLTEQSLCNNRGYNGIRKHKEGADKMIIRGKYNEAIVYTDVIEEGAMTQIKELCDIESFSNAKIRIMPDVHAGKGCVIGFTANLGEKVIPNIVGVDIGCGMLTVKLGKVDMALEQLDEFIHHNIPNGKAINQHKQVDFVPVLEQLKLLKDARQDLKKWNRAIGSLGGGNHFIEVNRDEDKNKYLVIHSGSRNLGYVVANHYQKQAIGYHSGYNDEFIKCKQALIESYKSEGRRKEIQDAIVELRTTFYKDKELPDDMCYLEGEKREEYLHDMAICQQFAELNRQTMADKILTHMFGHCEFESFHTTHNYIDFDDNIVRKGAIKASKNTEVLIPINMRDGSILAVGKGNDDWNDSAPHGAGRLMSRTRAFELIAFKAFKEEMAGIYSTSVTPKTIDESPMAYKSMEDIVDHIGDTVDIKGILKPIYNFKSQN
ncbi:RtcB family protein [Vallitalea pronyensis]|uniref:3'-phosphate/5'-hydroxy nucleic acid ligase n=1 Tax=Vallitalea pronyensis TaxID=1348613 RepID=A0A8J8MP13_9FIRM|nr:RtcB family protein [Vallitalea pronyensis]